MVCFSSSNIPMVQDKFYRIMLWLMSETTTVIAIIGIGKIPI
jgi:hypothetical protein